MKCKRDLFIVQMRSKIAVHVMYFINENIIKNFSGHVIKKIANEKTKLFFIETVCFADQRICMSIHWKR